MTLKHSQSVVRKHVRDADRLPTNAKRRGSITHAPLTLATQAVILLVHFGLKHIFILKQVEKIGFDPI